LCFHAGRDGRKGRTRVHGTIRPVMCLDGLHPLHISEPGGGAFSRNPQRACTCRCSALCASLVYLPCRTRKQRADDGGEGWLAKAPEVGCVQSNRCVVYLIQLNLIWGFVLSWEHKNFWKSTLLRTASHPHRHNFPTWNHP
jgi:hypothetical protein